jgi:hypothetical protein
MNRRLSICLPIASVAIIALTATACSQGPDGSGEGPSSSAASPIVQQTAVKRFRSQVSGNVTRVELLDEAGDGIGTLELTTEALPRVRAKQTVLGRTFEASWTDVDLIFTPEGKGSITVRAGEPRTVDEERALEEATDDLNIALGLARDVGVFSLLESEPAMPSRKPLSLGTGEEEKDKFEGSYWVWGTSQSAAQSAYNGSQNTAYTSCTGVYPSGGCATYQGATMTTSCSTGTLTTSCNTTITVAPCAGSGTCP